MTNADHRFDDIRPYYDREVPEAIARLLGNEPFRKAVEPQIAPYSWEQFTALMGSCNTKDDFQHTIIVRLFLHRVIQNTTREMRGEGWEHIEGCHNWLFISNHRDIVLDAAFLNILLFDRGMNTTEIAIGDNLLIHPWIRDIVRLNKSFIVRRNVPIRQMLEVSRQLSDYIYDTIVNREQSIWLAQREGRAKDSDDKTQVSLLKMLTLHDKRHPLEALKKLNIIPLSISYEYDPCDYLKAKEFQLKRDHADYKKSPKDDLENMVTGIMGYKGRVLFRFGSSINPDLNKMEPSADRNELLEEVAAVIDREIYRNYRFFPFNYIAYDRMRGSRLFAREYSEAENGQFDAYLDKQIQKIDLPDKDEDFLRKKIIEMYGNTVKNQIETQRLDFSHAEK